jgi:hypothetical protein
VGLFVRCRLSPHGPSPEDIWDGRWKQMALRDEASGSRKRSNVTSVPSHTGRGVRGGRAAMHDPSGAQSCGAAISSPGRYGTTQYVATILFDSVPLPWDSRIQNLSIKTWKNHRLSSSSNTYTAITTPVSVYSVLPPRVPRVDD